VRFNIRLSNKSDTCNSATIQVDNLGEAHRHNLERLKTVYVDLYAGYETSMPLLFRGDLRSVHSDHSGATWTTTITSDTGRKGRKEGCGPSKTKSKSFPPNVKIEEVLTHLAKVMDLRISAGSMKANAALLRNSNAQQFFNGYCLAGNAKRELDRITRSCGLEWQTHNKELHIIKAGKWLEETVPQLNARTGLIGRPSVGNNGEVKAQCLLIDGLHPMGRVFLDSVQIQGTCVIDSVAITGDTEGQPWTADLEMHRAA
jgi:post-segregation antitoxin (ccd killing protein)